MRAGHVAAHVCGGKKCKYCRNVLGNLSILIQVLCVESNTEMCVWALVFAYDLHNVCKLSYRARHC
jgi:hypothetical protein